MKLSFWQKVLAWLVEQIAPRLIAAALAKVEVDDIVASVTPFIRRIVNKIPTAYHASLKTLLEKVGEFFKDLAAKI